MHIKNMWKISMGAQRLLLFSDGNAYVLAKELATGVYRRENLDLKGLLYLEFVHS